MQCKGHFPGHNVNTSPPEISIHLESVVHDTIETFNEAVEVLHLLCHVLVALQSLMILPTHGRKVRPTFVIFLNLIEDISVAV